MAIDFENPPIVTYSSKSKFGLCDDQPPLPKGPAYLDEDNGGKWVAVISNEPRFPVRFVPIDNSIEILRADGKSAKRCDGMMSFKQSVIFVELKEIDMKGNDWIKKADEQLRTTIGYFEDEDYSKTFKIKKAYIANSERPKFRDSQQVRMEKFEDETGYVLRIENRIIL
jgi:hypothetical protein